MESTNPYADLGLKDYAAFAPQNEQTRFARRVFASFAGAIVLQTAILLTVFWLVPIHNILHTIALAGPYSWLVGLCAYLLYLYASRKSLGGLNGYTAIGAYLVHILATTAVLVPLFALSTTIDRSMPAITAAGAFAVIGGLTAYAQFDSVESLKHRGIAVVVLLAIGTGLAFFVSGNGLSVSEWLVLGSILLTAVFIVLDIGNMMCRYRTNEWLRSSLNQFSTLAVILSVFLGIAVLIF